MTYIESVVSHVSMMTYIEGVVTHVVVLAIAYALAFQLAGNVKRKSEAPVCGRSRSWRWRAAASCKELRPSYPIPPEGTARVVEGLITGVGFIGGGAILKHGASVQGTATAASLWATGAIGTTVGLGSFEVAIAIMVLTFLTLKLLSLIKDEGSS